MPAKQDVFLSHAGEDKKRYVEPLALELKNRGITFWLDTHAIAWGDNIVTKMSDGLRDSRFAIICLSENFIKRPWPQNELSAVLAMQTEDGVKRVLPLILNSKELVLNQYPFLAAFAFKEFIVGPEAIANDLAWLLQHNQAQKKALQVVVESRHTGFLSNLEVSPNASVRWLIDKASASLGVRNEAETGAYMPFRVRWVLVDSEAEEDWQQMPRAEQRKVHAIFQTDEGTKISTSGYDRIAALNMKNNRTFHLYAIEDEDFDLSAAAAE
ncbi:toll/interleukin-1 receptor domain-containing protein [Segetibacter sp. 3557_3]|uniref:toll/interleukin-1 receptor domain-containing protein n=1 Tax=Segetibacter sp. 3557_3 TaxID=2547429 RepID=UPI001058CD82|nr:toll/interleukin-1 receptor domain-containing protein [Segetibacter sp. 3557_3]TDH27403.1 toll/interleukin-1 receptor domain-containing protein [Segetibacter sp. 3557_3]